MTIPDTKQVTFYGVARIPLVDAGMAIADLILSGCRESRIKIEDGDIIVIAQKIVSKSEGRTVALSDVVPTSEALDLAAKTGRDPRFCQVVLDESIGVLRVKGKVIVTKHRLGFECTSAGVDKSNVASGGERVALLPKDPNASASQIRSQILQKTGNHVAVIINDSFGRRDRDGSVGIAIGISGIAAIEGEAQSDLFMNRINPRIALVDEVAAAASILMGQGAGRTPVVIARGINYSRDNTAVIQELLL